MDYPALGSALECLATSQVGAQASRAKGAAAAGVLLSTDVAQSTVNPTWSVSQMAWLKAEGSAGDDLDFTRIVVVRVFAVNGEEGPDATAALPSSPGTSAQHDGGVAVQRPLWEYALDVRELTALPVGSKLSQLRSLPADCLLLGMANGSLYSPGWVVEALEGSSALPRAIQVASRGGGAVDPWRDDDDEDEDDDQEPLEVVYRKVLNMESEAREARAELSAMLDRSSAARQRAIDACKDDKAMKALREELSMQEALLETEEAWLEREKRHLQREAVAVERLLDHVASAERAALESARGLQAEKAEMIKSQALLEARRARLTAELQAIYPIKYHPKTGEFSIRGLELPADLYSMDDERVSSALGYTAHLVCMLSKYLQVPLRYQLIYNASRSAVRDNVAGAGVAYPLFRRGVEKERFDKGVELFGRDVEQLLTARGVPVKRGGGHLLRNLERLMAIEGA